MGGVDCEYGGDVVYTYTMQRDIDEVLHFNIHRLLKDVSNGFEITSIAVDMLTVRTYHTAV